MRSRKATTLRYPTVAIRLAGLILLGDQAEVGGHLSTIAKAMWIVDAGYEDLGGAWTDSWYCSDSSDARIVLTDQLKSLYD